MESHCLWNSRHVRQNHHPKSIRNNCICLYSLSLPLSLYDMLYFLKTWNVSCHFSSHSHADTFSYVWTQCLLTNLGLRVYISFDKIHSWYCSKFYFVCEEILISSCHTPKTFYCLYVRIRSLLVNLCLHHPVLASLLTGKLFRFKNFVKHSKPLKESPLLWILICSPVFQYECLVSTWRRKCV